MVPRPTTNKGLKAPRPNTYVAGNCSKRCAGNAIEARALLGRQTRFGANRYEPYLNSSAQGCGDPLQHRERMPLVIGVFQLANDRSRRTDQFGQFALRQARLGPEVVNRPRDRGVRAFLFHRRQPVRICTNIALVEVIKCPRVCFLRAHDHFSGLKECPPGAGRNCVIR